MAAVFTPVIMPEVWSRRASKDKERIVFTNQTFATTLNAKISLSDKCRNDVVNGYFVAQVANGLMLAESGVCGADEIDSVLLGADYYSSEAAKCICRYSKSTRTYTADPACEVYNHKDMATTAGW